MKSSIRGAEVNIFEYNGEYFNQEKEKLGFIRGLLDLGKVEV